MEIKRLVSEQGDMAFSNTPHFAFSPSNQCNPEKGKTYEQDVYFVVPEEEKEYTFTTGGTSNVFFTITVQQGGKVKFQKVQVGAG